MNHLTDDQVLGYVLGTLDEQEKHRVIEHLDQCSNCSAHVEAVRSEVNAISGVYTDIPIPEIPLPSRSAGIWRELLKVAAVLLVGIAIGYAASLDRPPDIISVVPYTVTASAPIDTGLVISEPVDLRI